MTNLFPFSTHSDAAISIRLRFNLRVFRARESLAVSRVPDSPLHIEGRRYRHEDDLLSKQNNVKLDSCIKSPISIPRHTSALEALLLIRREREESKEKKGIAILRLCCTNGFAFRKNRESLCEPIMCVLDPL